jgi:hypothetical protein
VCAGKILLNTIKISMLRSKMSIAIVLAITKSMLMLMPILRSPTLNKKKIIKKI